MKNILSVFMLSLVMLTSCDKETNIAVNDLPATSNTFISSHFSETSVSNVVKDKDGTKTTYKVYLQNGTKLEFDKNGTIIDMEGHNALPEATLPAALVNYVKNNYPDVFIIEWELDGREQHVKLSSGLELEFDLNGNFLRVD